MRVVRVLFSTYSQYSATFETGLTVHRVEMVEPKVVMVGDQCQLPATVLSQKATKAGLDVSLFDRLLSNRLECHLLDRQYRMHPSMAAFASSAAGPGLRNTCLNALRM